VVIPDGTDIDLDGIELPVRITAGHTLQSTRGALRAGALLHLDRFGPRIALEVVGGGVTIRNLRLRGPSSATYDDRDPLTAIYVKSDYRAGIVGNEIFDWPGMGVQVNGPGEVKSCPENPPPPSYRVHVMWNYIHHIQRNPLGYGVRVEDGGVALVEG